MGLEGWKVQEASQATRELVQRGCERGPGNLRVDYVLPSRSLRIADSAVFWPAPGQPYADLVAASDHRLVWVDVLLGRR